MVKELTGQKISPEQLMKLPEKEIMKMMDKMYMNASPDQKKGLDTINEMNEDQRQDLLVSSGKGECFVKELGKEMGASRRKREAEYERERRMDDLLEDYLPFKKLNC
jgi:hypothetical protein